MSVSVHAVEADNRQSGSQTNEVLDAPVGSEISENKNRSSLQTDSSTRLDMPPPLQEAQRISDNPPTASEAGHINTDLPANPLFLPPTTHQESVDGTAPTLSLPNNYPNSEQHSSLETRAQDSLSETNNPTQQDPASAAAAQALARRTRLKKRAERFQNAPWIKFALALTGESPEIERLAKKNLKKIPNLSQMLRKELGGPHTPLALDVIATFELKDFFNDLLALSEQDEDGFITQTLNMLLDKKNVGQLINTYMERLSQDERRVYYPGPAKASMIDTLDRLQVEFSSKFYKQLFSDSNFEVRMMAFHHLKNALTRRPNPALLPALKMALTQPPQQLRIAAIHLIGTLKQPLQKEASSLLNRCIQDRSMRVRSECQATVDALVNISEKKKNS